MFSACRKEGLSAVWERLKGCESESLIPAGPMPHFIFGSVCLSIITHLMEHMKPHDIDVMYVALKRKKILKATPPFTRARMDRLVGV